MRYLSEIVSLKALPNEIDNVNDELEKHIQLLLVKSQSNYKLK